ncbi:putative DNA binding domain-containing protein [Bradyrhizobium sp. Pear76]|uniref:ATP-binding protein n=1 Tax=Bradyrhizobium oropedii TaxID=1571201 RepID=UPI001E58997B|nr:ATP-binding protein [Bradyrhizobium oropedii]MCC8964510.1 putative DNA binding domain-containing protein [Bradyrhizobium oropedii]
MPTANPRALLRRLLAGSDEGPWLEFKHNNEDCDMIGRTLSACANAAMLADRDRAFIVWGIRDGTREKVGTSVRLQRLKKGGENLQNWLSRMIEPKLLLECFDFSDDGLDFSILAVEPTYDRPVRFAGSEYIRIGENVKPLKDFPEHERALWLATGRRKFEDAIALPNQTALDVLNLLNAETYYNLKSEPVPRNKTEILKRFSQLGFVVDDMEDGYHITNLGALLFANDISTFPSIATKSVRVIKYSGTNKMKSESETEGVKGYAVGFRPMLKFIMDRLPKEERFTGGVRKALSVYSETALREMVANALIHQDFTMSGSGPVVEIYKDRIEITNPGNSLIAVDRIIDERRSRNEKFAAAMREVGLCEERGGGIDKSIIEIEEMALPAPEFFPSENSMRVVLFGPKKFANLSKADRVWSCFCHCVVRWLAHDYMNNTSLRARFSLGDEDYQVVSSVIADAKKAGRIAPADKNQGNKYAKYIPFWAVSDD